MGGSAVLVAHCLGCSLGLTRAIRSLCAVRELPALLRQEITKSTDEKLKMHQKEAKWEEEFSVTATQGTTHNQQGLFYTLFKQT